MRLPLVAFLLAALTTAPAFAEETLRTKAKELFEPIPSEPPPLPGETSTPEKLALGKMLYFEPRLSDNRDYSCSTCHNLSMGGGDGRSSSSGRQGQLSGRKTQTVLNAVFNKSQYYDGRAADLKDQVQRSVMAFPGAMSKLRGGPTIFNPAETNAAKQRAIEELKGIPGYATAFKSAFPDAAEPITYDNVARAIAVFETTLITPDAPFDLWLKGDDAALSEGQTRGLKLFIDKGCAACHNGVNVGGASLARFGVAKNPGREILPDDDTGRFAVTRNAADKYVFKVQGLRNVELNAPYFHSGRVWDLKQAVGIMAEAQLGQNLADAEVDDLTAFLNALTGRQPKIVLPILPPSVATTPRPEP
ncbi:MAG TPA: cytochrome c peroxidase [Methylocystis sp.]|nr:cytochrome c peroxidase [Methylocystis sp.]